jgi:hypothetical protein
MPNKSRPHKRSVPRLASRSARARSQSAPAHSVKDLLARAVPILSQAADQTALQAFWRPWLEAHLPPDLASRITATRERDGSLVVFAESPAWSARLRYALQELAGQIREARAGVSEVSVRVMPRPAKQPRS